MMEKSYKTCANAPVTACLKKVGICARYDKYQPTQYDCDKCKYTVGNNLCGIDGVECKYEGMEGESVKTYDKPPIGVIPEKIHKLQRCQDLSRAIQEYLHCEELKIDKIYEWSNELFGLIAYLKSKHK